MAQPLQVPSARLRRRSTQSAGVGISQAEHLLNTAIGVFSSIAGLRQYHSIQILLILLSLELAVLVHDVYCASDESQHFVTIELVDSQTRQPQKAAQRAPSHVCGNTVEVFAANRYV